MEKEQEIIRTSLRLAKSLYERLEKSSAEKGMTMHAEIIARLEQSFAYSEADAEFRAIAKSLGDQQADLDRRIRQLEEQRKNSNSP